MSQVMNGVKSVYFVRYNVRLAEYIELISQVNAYIRAIISTYFFFILYVSM